MNKTWIILKRELAAFFDSLMAYITIVLFLGFSGLFTWLYGSDIFFAGQASLQVFFQIAYWTLFFFIPALTMRMIAEESAPEPWSCWTGAKPVTDWQVVLGKFLATLALIVIALVLTLPYYITVANIGNVDRGASTGYLGLLLMSAAYISIGVFASSISENQIVGFLVALFIGIFFHIVFGFLASNFSGTVGEVLHYLSMNTHFDSISRGVIDTKDLVYFFSVIFLGLVSTEAVLSKRHQTD
ncbi:MAG: ABC transporter permease [Bacteroidales bacterium]|nr:ABC transporter permease [Bacteroidales bacterium]